MQICEPKAFNKNIGVVERKKRYIFGYLMLFYSALMGYFCLKFYLAPIWRLNTAIPLFLGILGCLQARSNICVLLARMGLRNMGLGNSIIEEEDSKKYLRKRSLWVLMQSIILTLVITGIFYALPL